MNNNFKKWTCLILVLFSFVFILSTNSSAFAQINSDLEKVYCNATLDDDFSDNEILVVLNKKVSRQVQSTVSFGDVDCLSVEDLTSSFDTEEEMNENFRRIYKISLRNSGKEKVLENIRKLEKISYVYSAGPNFYYYLMSESSPIQVAPTDKHASLQYSIENMNLQESWHFSTGSNDVTVGIIDTGIDGSHPDLQANINTTLSKSYIENDVNPLEDNNGHGTHIAGIVGAVGNNIKGVVGTNWNVSIVSLKAAYANGNYSSDGIVNAINEANDMGIDILNLSGGGGDDGSIKSVIEDYNGLIVCAAGNNGKDTDININAIYPACYDLPNLISVGALDSNDNRRSSSNYGANTVQIYAPGGDVLSTFPTAFCEELTYIFNDNTRLCELPFGLAKLIQNIQNLDISPSIDIDNIFSDVAKAYYQIDAPELFLRPADCKTSTHVKYEDETMEPPQETDNNGYHFMSGTSMATPQVAGVAALLLSINPNLTAAQLKSAILNGAETITITLPNTDKITPAPTQVVKKLDAFGAVKQIISGCSTVWGLRYNEHNLSQTVGEGSYFVDNNVMIKLVVRGAGNYKFNMSSTKPLNATLYDSNLNAIDITPTYSNGNCTINLSQYLAFGTYYLRVNFADAADSGKISVTVSHNHIYDDWQYYSHSEHISACKCGKTAFEKRPHIIRSSDIVNYRANCLECHYLLDLREDIVVSPYGSGLKVSVNGSYICPSGIVVLVEEDVDAYFAGTLRFYEQDQLPQQE